MKPLVKTIAYFLTAVVLSKCLGVLQSFIMAKTLGPSAFGIWITLLLLVAYAPIGGMGTVETMLKQVPYYRGRQDLQKVHEIEDGVMGSAVISALAVLLMSFLAPIFLNSTSLHVHLPLVIVTLITVAISYFTGYFYYRFAAYENFHAMGIMDFLRAVLSLVLVAGMGWKWGLKGAVVGFLLVEVLICSLTILLNIRCHGRPGLSFKRSILFDAIRIGFPITIVWWVLILQNSIDRLVLGSMLDPLAVGHYGLGVSIAATLAIVPMVVGRVLYPAMNKQLGASDPDLMRQLVMAPTVMLGAIFANMQALALVGMPILYTHFLPKYHPGLLAGQILVLGCFFPCMLRNGANYLVASNKQFLFLKYVLACLAATATTDIIAVRIGWGIEGVAVGTSLAAALLYALVWRRVALDMGFRGLCVWTQIGGLYLPLIVLAASMTALWFVFGDRLESISFLPVATLTLLLILLNGTLLCIPAYRTTMLASLRVFFSTPKGASKAMNVLSEVS